MSEQENSYAAVHQLLQWKRYKEALKEAETLLQQNPDDSNAHALVAWTYVLMEEFDKAMNWADQTLGLDPENELGWFARVHVLYRTQKEKACLEAIQEALRIDPNEHYYYFMKSSLLNKKGKFEEAKEQILIALEFDPHSAIYLSLLSYLEALLNNTTESEQMEQLALQYEVEEPLVYMQLAWAVSERGEYTRSEEYMKQAIRLNPEDKQIRDEYIEALEKNNKLYRMILKPMRLLRLLKPWQILLLWIFAWIVFKPLVVIFIALTTIVHWTSKIIVHVKVFGWTLRK